MYPFSCIHSKLLFLVTAHSHGSFPRCTLMMRLIISAFSYTLVFRVVCSCFNCSQMCPEVALSTSGYLIRENGATQWALIREQQTVCVWACVWFALKSMSSTQHSKYICFLVGADKFRQFFFFFFNLSSHSYSVLVIQNVRRSTVELKIRVWWIVLNY